MTMAALAQAGTRMDPVRLAPFARGLRRAAERGCSGAAMHRFIKLIPLILLCPVRLPAQEKNETISYVIRQFKSLETRVYTALTTNRKERFPVP
jgi:hypothetical protein